MLQEALVRPMPAFFESNVPEPAAAPGSVFIRSGLRYHHVSLSEIIYVEARRNFCMFNTTRGGLMALAKMCDLETLLAPPGFCRIHRSYIVGLAYIKCFDRKTVHLLNNKELPIGDTYFQALLHSKPVLGTGTMSARPLD